MATMAQSALCNRVHEVEQRLARWLLTAADRMESERLDLTQEMLAGMLGSRRSTITLTASALQRRKIITYSRGKLTILDRTQLEAVACECYGLVRQTYDWVVAPHSTHSSNLPKH